MEPTYEQLRIIWHTGGPLLVLAVAGSGKTTSLLWLIGRLIAGSRLPDGHVFPPIAPGDILMATFSRRAAENMAKRAREMTLPPEIEFRTLHSIGFEVARGQQAREPIVPKGWQLARVVRDALKEMTEEGIELARPLRPGDVLREVALAKAALIWPDAWAAWNGSRFPGFFEWATTRAREPVAEDVADVIARCYAALERVAAAPELGGFARDDGKRWLSFDDQVAVPARAILRQAPDDAWARAWQGRFAWVLCDEVQDNTLAQWTLCEFLARDRNIVTVGDDQQAIFLWRGARPELMRMFLERYSDAKILPLSYNFRSGQKILDVANATLELAQNRLYFGKLELGRTDTLAAEVYVDEWQNPAEEAQQIADAIHERTSLGESPGRWAVLTRTKAALGAIELAFIRVGIPYRIAGSSFFSRGEVRTAVAYLALALDENDATAFEQAANVPTRYLGRQFLEKWPTFARARRNMAALGQWTKGVGNLGRALQEVKVRLQRDGGLVEALQHIFERIGVRRFYRDEDSDEEDATEVDEACVALVACAKTLGDAASLVRFARAMTTACKESPDEDPELDDTRVTLSTIHRAKGLEWDHVFIAGCNEGLLPLRRAPADEERRLFYVATTRARDVLVMSWTRESARGKPNEPSVFLVEKGLAEVQGDGEEAEETAQKAVPPIIEWIAEKAARDLEQRRVADPSEF